MRVEKRKWKSEENRHNVEISWYELDASWLACTSRKLDLSILGFAFALSTNVDVTTQARSRRKRRER